jgi:hypothetical protein
VVGGGGAPASGRRRAAYLADYGFYSCARPADARQPPLLTAANIAYARRVVAEVAQWSLEGAWENVLHDRLATQGAVLDLRPCPDFSRPPLPAGRLLHDALSTGELRPGRLTEDGGAAGGSNLLVAPSC